MIPPHSVGYCKSGDNWREKENVQRLKLIGLRFLIFHIFLKSKLQKKIEFRKTMLDTKGWSEQTLHPLVNQCFVENFIRT